MAKCYKCGTEFSGNFCPSCGTTYAGPSPAPAPQPVYNNISVVQPTTTTSVGGWIGWMLLCSALPLLGVIIMLLASNDPSAKNFAKAQLIIVAIVTVLSLVAILLMFLLGIGLAGAGAGAMQ